MTDRPTNKSIDQPTDGVTSNKGIQSSGPKQLFYFQVIGRHSNKIMEQYHVMGFS